MFRRVLGAALSAALVQIVCVGHVAAEIPPSADEAPLDISISTILKGPWRYHGKLVRVRGTFDECFSLTCSICESADPGQPREERSSICMGVAFREDDNLVPALSEEHLFLMRERAYELIERNVRFASVTLVARYNANCSGVRDPSLPADSDDVICTDRASQLRDARVVTVNVRRPATAAHIIQYLDELLTVPETADADALRTAFQAASSTYGSNQEDEPQFVFLDQTTPHLLEKHGIEAVGGACVCLLEDCYGIQWPKRVGDVYFDIPANPYKCWLAEKVGGVWKFPLQ